MHCKHILINIYEKQQGGGKIRNNGQDDNIVKAKKSSDNRLVSIEGCSTLNGSL